MVKLAIAIVLSGGSEAVTEDEKNTGVHSRSKPHLMLIGDAGTGKSQFLRFAAKVVPRSVLTTGIGSTSAGLTAAAIREDGEWQLEGGALVLADGGICCIDEFSTLKENDRTSIYEAMEQQTIHVAKGGIVRKLNTRCSILAASNPKVSLDTNEPLSSTSGLSSPLLSRFDLILILKDKIDPEWDERASDYVLNGCKLKTHFTDDHRWSIDLLQAYFVYIKRINPVLSEQAKKILVTYYQHRRRCVYRNKAQTTVRLFDSLIRLSQGHARFMCHNYVEVVDAISAISLIELSADTADTCVTFDVLAEFPDNPLEKYAEYKKTILEKLQLDEEDFPDPRSPESAQSPKPPQNEPSEEAGDEISYSDAIHRSNISSDSVCGTVNLIDKDRDKDVFNEVPQIDESVSYSPSIIVPNKTQIEAESIESKSINVDKESAENHGKTSTKRVFKFARHNKNAQNMASENNKLTTSEIEPKSAVNINDQFFKNENKKIKLDTTYTNSNSNIHEDTTILNSCLDQSPFESNNDLHDLNLDNFAIDTNLESTSSSQSAFNKSAFECENIDDLDLDL